jgi:DNA invertase Pin-like site-specific DNA recombinase
MDVGYARTSTVEQVAGFEAQIRELKQAGCEQIFQEQVSSVAQRTELDNALKYVRNTDTLIVTKLDRLARSTQHLLMIVEELDKKGVGLRILHFGGSEIDTKSSSGKLMLTMFGAMAEYERSLMLERQREGIAKAKAEGKYKGRSPVPEQTVARLIELRNAGVKPSEIAKQLSLGRSTVYRLIKESGLNPGSNNNLASDTL